MLADVAPVLAKAREELERVAQHWLNLSVSRPGAGVDSAVGFWASTSRVAHAGLPRDESIDSGGGAMLTTNQPVAISNLVQSQTGITIPVSGTNDPVEQGVGQDYESGQCGPRRGGQVDHRQ